MTATAEDVLEGLEAKLAHLTARERRLLLAAIAGLHERAYRRGFQQGAYFAGEGRPGCDPTRIARWRFRPIGRMEVPPPGSVPAATRMTILERLVAEVRSTEEGGIVRALVVGR